MRRFLFCDGPSTKRKQVLLAAAILLLLLPGRTWAHALGAQWKIKGSKVEVEAYFSDGTLAQGALVEVYHDGKRRSTDCGPLLMLRTKTDAKGWCSFSVEDISKVDGMALPYPRVYRIVIDAGAGHRKELPMRIVKLPAKAAQALLVTGVACLGGMEALSMGAILATDYSEESFVSQSEGYSDRSEEPNKEKFTAYPWGQVVIVVSGALAIVLVFWILRHGTTAT